MTSEKAKKENLIPPGSFSTHACPRDCSVSPASFAY